MAFVAVGLDQDAPVVRDLEEPLLPQPPSSAQHQQHGQQPKQRVKGAAADHSSPSLTSTSDNACLVVHNHNGHHLNHNDNDNFPVATTNAAEHNDDNDDNNNINSNDDSNSKDIRISLCGRRCLTMNHNVFLNLALCILYGMSDSLWSGTVFAAYLKRLGHEKNRVVGNVEAVNGLAGLLFALPVGYLADVYGRDKLIRLGCFLFVGTAFLHGWTMACIGTNEANLSDTDRQTSLILLGVVMGLWGVGDGIVNGPAEALYADSTPAGERSHYYHVLFVVYLASSCLGPIVSIILFHYIGDEWNLYQLRAIMYVGLGLELACAVLMMFFDDSKALDEGGDDDDEEEDERPSRQQSSLTGAAVADQEVEHNAFDCCSNKKTDVALTEVITTTTTTSSSYSTLDSTEDRGLNEPLLPAPPTTGVAAIGANTGAVANDVSTRTWMIPYIIFLSSLILSIGSGMTVKFFPLFFKDEVGMSPIQVQIIYVMVPVVMAILSGAGTRLSKTFGRVETTLLFEFLGTSCLFALVFAKTFLTSRPLLLVLVYVLHTGLLDAPYPLMESMLMDFVPKEQRARWKSLESIAVFGWCGSAAAGGYISDRWDYTRTFFITALIQAFGIFAQMLLLPLVPRSEQALSRNNNPTTITNTNTTEDNNSSNNSARASSIVAV